MSSPFRSASPPEKCSPGLGVAQRGQRDRRLARAGLADQRHDLSGHDVEADALDDRDRILVVRSCLDPEVAARENRLLVHHTIFLASDPPDWAEISSTIRLIAIVRVAIAMAGATEASAPALTLSPRGKKPLPRP